MGTIDKGTGRAKQAAGDIVGDESLRRDGAHMDPTPSVTHTSRAWARFLLFSVLAAVGFCVAILLRGNWQMVGAGVASLAVIAWAISFASVLASAERTVTARTRDAPRAPAAHRFARSMVGFGKPAETPRPGSVYRTSTTPHRRVKTSA